MVLRSHGSGSPTVVLVSGSPDTGAIWSTTAPGDPGSAVFDAVGMFTRVCVYDRPGTVSDTGPTESTPVHQPTSAGDAAIDLRALLAASGESAPYVLVGHSYGAPIARLYASANPEEVAGLILLDGYNEHIRDRLTHDQRRLVDQLENPPADSGRETVDDRTTDEQLRNSSPVPQVPVVVLSADRNQLTPEVVASGLLPDGVDQDFADALWSAQTASQRELAAQFPHARHITETHSTHYIHRDNPKLVVAAIHDVVNEATPGDRLC